MINQQVKQTYDVTVVGAGVYGLCIAYYLSKNNPNLKICLLQQFQIGHSNGSSHSPTRITRSTYETEVYRDLNLLCLQKNWPEMTRILEDKIVYNTPYILYDEDEETYEFYKKVASVNESFKFMTPEDIAKQYYPMPVLNSKMTPIVDTKAGIIAADTFIERLGKYLKDKCQGNLVVKQKVTVKGLAERENNVEINITNNETLESIIIQSSKVIVSGGRWLSQLVPQVADLVKVVKQFMGYIQLKDHQKYDVTKFNSFSHRTKTTHFWSLPDRKGHGVKLGNHNLDKLLPQQDNSQYHMKLIEQKAKQIFKQQFIQVNKVQVCWYTVTKNEDFIMDWSNSGKKIFVCSCCSGHGFKFAPLIGQIISDVVVKGHSIELYQKWKQIFTIDAHEKLDWKW